MTTNPFDIDTSPESPELLAIAEKELRETPEIRQVGFAKLRELLKENPDLSYSDEEEFLIIVLRACHWYPESALKLVNNYDKCFIISHTSVVTMFNQQSAGGPFFFH